MTGGREALRILMALAVLGAAPLTAQSWRLRFDAAAQRVAIRAISPDSITEAEVQTGPTGGPGGRHP